MQLCCTRVESPRSCGTWQCLENPANSSSQSQACLPETPEQRWVPPTVLAGQDHKHPPGSFPSSSFSFEERSSFELFFFQHSYTFLGKDYFKMKKETGDKDLLQNLAAQVWQLGKLLKQLTPNPISDHRGSCGGSQVQGILRAPQVVSMCAQGWDL